MSLRSSFIFKARIKYCKEKKWKTQAPLKIKVRTTPAMLSGISDRLSFVNFYEFFPYLAISFLFAPSLVSLTYSDQQVLCLCYFLNWSANNAVHAVVDTLWDFALMCYPARSTTNPSAWHCKGYFRGLFIWHSRSRESHRGSTTYFELLEIIQSFSWKLSSNSFLGPNSISIQ